MLPDLLIARSVVPQPISEVAEKAGILPSELFPYRNSMAKVSDECFARLADQRDGKLILVTAINPTPAGEGKTTMSIGLADALRSLGKRAILALREPSLGPVFGIKGGAAGGGKAQVIPMEEINLHFTGDFHAITAANNLLAAVLDNHIFQGNELNIDPERILFRRCLDMNDRALRQVRVQIGKDETRADSFQITAASEVMATFCLARDLEDLKARLSEILIAYTKTGEAVRVRDLGCAGAMCALLRDALMPNLVQTLEHTPCLVHGGPFANIAHGCNSVRATRLALKLSDFTVTEAGFGAELGAEKFFDIKCRALQKLPDAVVLVASVRALKYNGGVPKDNLNETNVDALRRGLCNLEAHIENLHRFGVLPVVCINHFPTDADEETLEIQKACEALGVPVAVSKAYSEGSSGAVELAKLLLKTLEVSQNPHPLYDTALPIREKIECIAKKLYGAASVVYEEKATESIQQLTKLSADHLPVCIAKTQYSLSDDAKALGRPRDFVFTVRNVALSAGAGFLVVYAGSILTMPGFSKHPAALDIDVDDAGEIVGLF